MSLQFVGIHRKVADFLLGTSKQGPRATLEEGQKSLAHTWAVLPVLTLEVQRNHHLPLRLHDHEQIILAYL